MTPRRKLTLVMSLLLLAACGAAGPTQPTGSSPSRLGEAFEVAGTVTDERGVPVPGATVVMATWLGGTVIRPSAVTDPSGRFRLSFTATVENFRDFVARAEVSAAGYEEYWRSIKRSVGATSFVENFRLDRITRIAAGESVVLSVPVDVGECRGWVAEVCPYVRVSVPTSGRLSIEVMPIGQSGELPPVEFCCVDGDEKYGNPMTVSVVPGPDFEVKVGLRRGFATTQSFLVKTSLVSP